MCVKFCEVPQHTLEKKPNIFSQYNCHFIETTPICHTEASKFFIKYKKKESKQMKFSLSGIFSVGP